MKISTNMTTCILCLGQLKKGKSVKLSEPICDTFTLGDALRQQIRSNILLPYTKSSSNLTCKSCLNSFQNFFKFLRKVNLNLNNFKTENTFEITPDCTEIYVPPNVLMLKMEPQILLPRIKVEPELTLSDEGLVKVDVFESNFQENVEDKPEAIKDDDNDRFSDDSDFAWSYDDPMDSIDDNEADNDKWNGQLSKKCSNLPNKKSESNQNSELVKKTEDSSHVGSSNSKNPSEKTTKSNTASNRSTRNSNQCSNSSDIKIEHSDDELDNSEIKHEDMDDSEDDRPLVNRKSSRSTKVQSKSTKKSTSQPESPEKKSQNSSDTPKKPRPKKSTTSTSRTRKSASTALPDPSNSSDPTAKPIKSETTNPTDPEDSKADIKPSLPDPNGPLPLFPAKSKTGYIRYLPRDQITQEMIDSGQLYVVIDGVEYRIPQKPGTAKPKKKKKSAGFTREEDASRRSHPAHDPEGQEKIKNFMDIKCYVCGSEFESFFKLKKHFKRFHPNNQVYLTCCNRNFRRRCDLLDHIEQHDKSAIHKCEICNKVYKTKGCLRTHMRFYHPKDGGEKVICYECGKICNNSNLLKLHLLSHENDPEKSYECYICSKKFRNIHNVKRHLKLSHALSSDKVICHICSASVREAYLSTHMRTLHNSDRTRVNCERCGIWVLKSTFKVHMMKHTDMGVNCKVCGKFLKSTYSLTTHMKTVHSDNFKFRCNYCDKGFHRDVKMQEHIAVKHTREFPFKCRIAGCGREFRAEGNWRSHEKKAHPEEYNKYYKPFYMRDDQELQELEEMLEANGGQL
ncbi:zinc finger protein 37-like [Chironomus tepperi]|uniref:zinc finger protein 37-like n=1 Tax=Chironomus tepperi TaxID=113505 RepID=UPI00391F3096